jgi:hypothetical protein
MYSENERKIFISPHVRMSTFRIMRGSSLDESRRIYARCVVVGELIPLQTSKVCARLDLMAVHGPLYGPLLLKQCFSLWWGNASSGKFVVREAGDGGVVDDDNDDDDDEWDRGIRFFVGVARVGGLETTTDAAPVVCGEQFGERRRRRIGVGFVVGAAKEV